MCVTVHLSACPFCYYQHENTAVIATTIATLLHVSGYYTGEYSFVSLGSKAITVVECVQFQEEYTCCSTTHQANNIILPAISLMELGGNHPWIPILALVMYPL